MPAQALDEARRRVVDEACPALARDAPGPNGVMAPREVQCRLVMGETYEEVEAEMQARQRAEAERRAGAALVLRRERERTFQARLWAQIDAVALCQALVREHEEGRWFTSSATAPRLIRGGNAHGHPVEAAALAQVTAFMDGLGHNYAEPDQRALVLRGAPQDGTLAFWQLNPILDVIAANIAARAREAEFDDTTGRHAVGGVHEPASAAGYAFRCFLKGRFGSLMADPFSRVMQ